jgi:hypothetical protein
MREAGSELQLGGARFERAAEFVRSVRREQSLPSRALGVLRDPQGLFATAYLLGGLPRLEVTLSDGSVGRLIARHANERHRGVRHHRVAQAVLELPPTREDYLAGRRRQAVRTNLRRAEELGIVAVPIFGPGPRPVAEPWLARPFPDPDSAFTLAEQMHPPHFRARGWLAVDPDGMPLALGVISLDEELALVNTLLGAHHLAGWLLHTQLVSAAIEAGARYLWVGSSPLLLEPGLHYFQRRLGYGMFHLRIRRARRRT